MSESKLERGKTRRREVLGQPTDDLSDFMAPYGEISLEFAWGAIWARDGLPTKTRRFLTLALLAQQGRPRELESHIRAALADSCTPEEIREVFLHMICYCGFPAVSEALRIAGRVVEEHQAKRA